MHLRHRYIMPDTAKIATPEEIHTFIHDLFTFIRLSQLCLDVLSLRVSDPQRWGLVVISSSGSRRPAGPVARGQVVLRVFHVPVAVPRALVVLRSRDDLTSGGRSGTPCGGRRGDDHIPRPDPHPLQDPHLRGGPGFGAAPQVLSFPPLHLSSSPPRLGVCHALRVMTSGSGSCLGVPSPTPSPLGEIPTAPSNRQPPSSPRRFAARGRADRGRTGRRAAAACGRARPPESRMVSGRSLDMSAVNGIKGCDVPNSSRLLRVPRGSTPHRPLWPLAVPSSFLGGVPPCEPPSASTISVRKSPSPSPSSRRWPDAVRRESGGLTM